MFHPDQLREEVSLPPVTVARVSLCSVSDGKYLLLRRLPSNHRFSPGKIDLISHEAPTESEFSNALGGALAEAGITSHTAQEFLGTDRTLDFYEGGQSVRDTRRVVFTLTDTSLDLYPLTYERSELFLMSPEDILSLPIEMYRRSVIRHTLTAHADYLRGLSFTPFTFVNTPSLDQRLERYLEENPWKIKHEP